MEYTTRWVGWIGFVLGSIVLFSYALRRKIIYSASEDLRHGASFFLWAASAFVTTVCFLLVLSLWALHGNKVTDSDDTARVFVVGLFVFMTGAILWPWVLQLELTLNEVSALWITAIGSFIMFYATWWQAMSVPFTAFIFFHHFFVDGLWWPCYGRISGIDKTNGIAAVYIFYFAPLVACIPLSIFEKTRLVAGLVVVVTGLHFIAGGIIACPNVVTTALQRYKQKLAVLADVMILVALVLSVVHLSTGMKYSWTAVIFAFLGNLFCWKTRARMPPTSESTVVLLS